MSEYQSGPQARKAQKANHAKCAKWASKTAGYSEVFKVPFGVRSDVGDNDFYKLRPGEVDDIECGSMGVPDHERYEMEASMGMRPFPSNMIMVPHPSMDRRRSSSRSRGSSSRRPRSHSHSYAPPATAPGMPGPMPHGPHPGAYVMDHASPPPSAGFSTRRRASSRAAPPAPLPLPQLSIPSPYSSSPVTSPAHRSTASGSYFTLGGRGHSQPFVAPSSMPVSPYDSSGGQHHHSKNHHRSRSHSRHNSPHYIISPPQSRSQSPSPFIPPVSSKSSRSPAYNIYMPQRSAGPMMPTMMRHATMY